jgi:hypothetical protein
VGVGVQGMDEWEEKEGRACKLERGIDVAFGEIRLRIFFLAIVFYFRRYRRLPIFCARNSNILTHSPFLQIMRIFLFVFAHDRNQKFVAFLE